MNTLTAKDYKDQMTKIKKEVTEIQSKRNAIQSSNLNKELKSQLIKDLEKVEIRAQNKLVDLRKEAQSIVFNTVAKEYSSLFNIQHGTKDNNWTNGFNINVNPKILQEVKDMNCPYYTEFVDTNNYTHGSIDIIKALLDCNDPIDPEAFKCFVSQGYKTVKDLTEFVTSKLEFNRCDNYFNLSPEYKYKFVSIIRAYCSRDSWQTLVTQIESLTEAAVAVNKPTVREYKLDDYELAQQLDILR